MSGKTALDQDQGQDCGDNSALRLDGSRRRHCGARIEKTLAWSIFRLFSLDPGRRPLQTKECFR
ncbi:MAG TPA: hypothetical protein VGP28_05690 [Methylocella sp.]|nr:hypothetical protein [Methylocella sp.]